ncbi:MAG: ankyrin repeat domain-containing protein [Bacteroidales bacterium]
MLSVKTSLVRILLSVIILTCSGKVSAQIEVIDTSAYILPVFRGYLEYNLMIAAAAGYPSEIDRLINLGAEADAQTAEGITALIYAVANNREEVVRMLVSHGADPDIITSDRKTALHIASSNNNISIAEILVRAGANIDFADKYGATALHYACIYGYFYMVDMLLYYYADPDIKARDGTTPLMAAILAGNADIADLLIQKGANMEGRDNNGFTPLMIAAQNGDTLLMNLLIKKGVNINAINNYNYDALAVAIKSNSTAAAELLVGRAGITTADRSAVNPYKVASVYKREEILDLMAKYDVPGKYKYAIDELAILASSKFVGNDIFAGAGLTLKEPYLNGGFIAGIDTKLWYSRVLVKENEDLYYQYMDKRSIFYLGLFKEFSLTERLFRGNYSIVTSLSAAKIIGNKFSGTRVYPDSRLRLVPSVELRWSKNSISFFCGAEYTKTEFYRIGPIWGRAGFSYSIFINHERSPDKVIRWN